MVDNNTNKGKGLWKYITSIVIVIIGSILSIYIFIWLEGTTDIEINLVDNYVLSKGLSDRDEDLVLDLKSLTYKGIEYNSLRVVSFLITNVDDTRDVQKDTGFVFVNVENNKNRDITPDAVLDISFETTTPIDVVVEWKWEREGRKTPKIVLDTSLPAKAVTKVTLTVNTDKYKDFSDSEIDLKLLAPGGDITIKPMGRLLSFSAASFALWLIASASVWGLAWCGINIALGNYSTGARIVFGIMKVLKLKKYIPSKYKEEYRQDMRKSD